MDVLVRARRAVTARARKRSCADQRPSTGRNPGPVRASRNACPTWRLACPRRLWVAHDRLRFMFSLQSLVDFLTVVPMVAAFWADHNTGFASFESCIRILRVLRVFRIFRCGARQRRGGGRQQGTQRRVEG